MNKSADNESNGIYGSRNNVLGSRKTTTLKPFLLSNRIGCLMPIIYSNDLLKSRWPFRFVGRVMLFNSETCLWSNNTTCPADCCLRIFSPKVHKFLCKRGREKVNGIIFIGLCKLINIHEWVYTSFFQERNYCHPCL